MKKRLTAFLGGITIIILLAAAVVIAPTSNGGEDPPHLASNAEIVNIL